MVNWFINLSNPDKIELFSILASLLTSIIAIGISIKSLKQTNNSLFESSRANIVFYIDTLTGGQQFLTIKNFGKSIGKIINVDITPKLDYSKSPNFPDGLKNPVITDYTDILLAPNQCIKSWFPFSNYPDKVFNITVKYVSLGKEFIETYKIDLEYIEAIDYIRKHSMNISDTKDALYDINNTLKDFSERF